MDPILGRSYIVDVEPPPIPFFTGSGSEAERSIAVADDLAMDFRLRLGTFGQVFLRHRRYRT